MTATRETIVGILEDDDDMRTYLSRIIEDTDGMRVGFAAALVSEARDSISETTIDICLVDLQLPDGNGLDFVADLKEKSDAKILILTVLGDKTSVLLALQAGANGYLLKDTMPDQIRRDIRSTLDGGNPISPQAATHLLQIFQTPPVKRGKKPDELASLTQREVDILTMFSKGLSYKETANALNISRHTVSDYVKSIYKKLSVHSRNEAIFEAVQQGWLDL